MTKILKCEIWIGYAYTRHKPDITAHKRERSKRFGFINDLKMPSVDQVIVMIMSQKP